MSIHHLTHHALFANPDAKGLGLYPPSSLPKRQGEETNEEHSLDYRFVQKVITDGSCEELPLITANYPREVREVIRDAEADRFYVVPPFLSLHQLEDSIRNSLGETYGRHTDLSMITVLSMLKELDPRDRIAFTVPRHSMTTSRSRKLKGTILEHAHPKVIIQPQEHPLGSDVHQDLQVQTLVFSGQSEVQEQSPVTRFFAVPSREGSEANWKQVKDDFNRLLEQGGGETEFGYVTRGQLDPKEAWSFESYEPGLERAIQEIREIGAVKPLGELFEVKYPSRSPNSKQTVKKSLLFEEIEYEGNVPVIGSGDIRSDGTVNYRDVQVTIEREQIGRDYILDLQAGDICMRRQTTLKHGLVAAEIDGGMLPIVASPSVVVLRPKGQITEEERQVILQYLQSETASRYLIAKSGMGAGLYSQVRIDGTDLNELPVPKADDDLRGAIRSLTDAAHRFGQWKKEALEIARSLFDFPKAKDGKMYVLTSGRRTRQRQNAAERQDDLSYRVQTQFPHPVAYRWRTVASAKPDLEGYLHVLECAEVLACYLALVSITMARHVGEKIGYLEGMGNRVARGRGTNLGDWIAILREGRDSKSFRQLSDDTPFYEVMRFMPEDGKADQALASLKTRRDRQAHGKGPRGDSVKPAFEEAKNDLLEFLEAAEFLSEYPLRYIERTRADTIESRLTYWYRDVMGDHPLVPVESDTVEPRTLEAGSLYLVDRSGTMHLLRPLLDRRRCPVCGTWSTFYLDSYLDDEDACLLKSMEHSHTTTDEDIYAAFQKTGILP